MNEALYHERDRVVEAARALRDASRTTMSLEAIPQAIIHDFFDAMFALELAENKIKELERFARWWLTVGVKHMPTGDRPPEHGAIAELAWMAALKEPR